MVKYFVFCRNLIEVNTIINVIFCLCDYTVDAPVTET